MKALESLIGMIQKFPYDDPTYDKLHEDLDRIRGKFKQVCPLHVSLRFGSAFLRRLVRGLGARVARGLGAACALQAAFLRLRVRKGKTAWRTGLGLP